jgi:hypothetical protein
MATGPLAGRSRNRGSIPGKGKKFSLLHKIQTGSGTHPASYLMDTGSLSPEVKRSGRETDNSPPSNAEVKYGGAIPPLLHASSWRSALLFKHKDNFTLHLPYSSVICHLYEPKLCQIATTQNFQFPSFVPPGKSHLKFYTNICLLSCFTVLCIPNCIRPVSIMPTNDYALKLYMKLGIYHLLGWAKMDIGQQ